MNHGYFQDRLSAYFDQSLTLEEMQAIKEHLESCAECREQLDDLAKLDRLIEAKADLGESDYWEKAAQKIESRLTSPEKADVTDVRSSWFGLGWKLVATAASIAALTFIALHEDEIQNSAVKSKRATETATAPSRTFNAPSMPDTGTGQAYDFVDTEAESPEPKPALEPTAERSALKDKSPDLNKSSVTSVSEDASEKVKLDHSPVTSVDELLESVAGVVTNADGEIFIRGGRAGEVAYIVDGVPIGDPLGGLAEDTSAKEVVVDLGTIALERKRTDIGKTITVQGKRDIIDKFEVSNQAAITKEQLATSADTPTLEDLRAKFQYLEADTSLRARIMRQPVTSVEELLEQVEGVVTNKDGEIFISGSSKAKYVIIKDGSSALDGLGDAGANLTLPPRPADSLDAGQKLDWWRTTRDSLKQQLDSAPGVSTRSRYFKNMGAKERAEVDPVGLEKDRIASRFLKACFDVAILTDSEDEYDDAWFAIAKYADDNDSPLQEMARHYIERLAIIEKQRQDQE